MVKIPLNIVTYAHKDMFQFVPMVPWCYESTLKVVPLNTTPVAYVFDD